MPIDIGRRIEQREYLIPGTQVEFAQRLGWVAVKPTYDNGAERNRLGSNISLSVADITHRPVTVHQDVYIDDGEIVATSTTVRGVENSNNGVLLVGLEGQTDHSGWYGAGYYHISHLQEFRQAPFGFSGYRNDAEFSDGEWAIGEDNIIRLLKASIRANIQNPDVVDMVYSSMYLRFNQLIADSYRNRSARSGTEMSRSLRDELVIDEASKPAMRDEHRKGSHYLAFTDEHIAVDEALKTAFEEEFTFVQREEFARRLKNSRDNLLEKQRTAQAVCDSMYESSYVGAGCRRTWPYMDLDDYRLEFDAIMAGNPGHAIRQLKDEIRELRYKRDETLVPRLEVVRLLAQGRE